MKRVKSWAWEGRLSRTRTRDSGADRGLRRGAARFALLVIVSLLLGGCGTRAFLTRSEARPGVVIQGVTKNRILIALINEMVTVGTQLRSLSETGAVFARRQDSAAKPGSEIRITFDLVSSRAGIHVLVSGASVTNIGGGVEKVTDATSGSIAQQMKAMLQRLKTHLESES